MLSVFKKRDCVFFFLAFCCTILSQTQWAVSSGLNSVLQASWLIVIALIVNIRLAEKLVLPILLLSFVVIYCLLMESISGRTYLDILVLPRVPIVILMLYIGLCLSRHIVIDDFVKLLVVSSVVGSILMLYFLYISVGEEFVSVEDSKFSGSGKNTVAIMILTMIYTIYKLGKFNSLIPKLCFTLLAVVAVSAMILLRCRTAVLTIPILLLIEPIMFKDKKVFVTVMTIILSITLFVIIVVPDIGHFLITDFIFNDTNTMKMNSMDDRYNLMKEGYKAFEREPIFGSGYRFVENFYLINLFNLGIVGFIPLFLFLSWTTFLIFYLPKNEITSLNRMLFVLFFLNGALEAESPFGPGTRCFLFWLLLGYSLNHFDIVKQHRRTLKRPMKISLNKGKLL